MEALTPSVRAVARNTTWLMAGHVVGMMSNLAAGLLLARYLGASDYGLYSWAFAYLAFFQTLTDLGIASIVVRDVAKEPPKAGILLANAAGVKLLLCLVATVLACVLVSLMHQPVSTKAVVYIASLSLLITAFGPYGLLSVIFQVKLRMEYPVGARIVTSLATLGSFFLLAQMSASLAYFVAATVLSNLLGLCIVWRLSTKLVDLRFSFDIQVVMSLLKQSWPLALNALFTTTYARLGMLMLLEMKGAEEVGYYAAAVRLTEILTPFVAAFMTSVFPLMSAYSGSSASGLQSTYRLSFKYVLMSVIPVAAAVTLLSRPTILITFGEDFLPAAPVLSVLIWSQVFVFYGFVHYFLLISVGKQRIFLLFTGIAAATNISLNLLLIPAHGALGASLASLPANVFGAGLIVGHLLPSTRTYNVLASRYIFKPLIASGVMALYMRLTMHNLLLAVAGAAPVFAIAMLCLGGIASEDLRLVRAIFRERSAGQTREVG